MKKRNIFILLFVILCLWNRHASAFFWGNNSAGTNSGLDVAAGFDVNTITTVTGKVLTPPEHKGQEQHTEMSVLATQGTMAVILGPWSYWEKQTITISKNQDISVTGSIAQGKNGALYLFAQHLENLSNGETVILRSDSGKPLWSRSGSGNQNGTNQNRGSSPRSGTGNRGSGGGMRGGGGR